MHVVALAAGRSLSAAQLDEVTSTLRGAIEQPVEVDLFSWSPVEGGAAVRTARVLGPVTSYRPPAPPPVTAPPPTPGLLTSADQAPSDDQTPLSDQAVVSVPPAPDPRTSGRRALGRAHWALRRALTQFRRSEVYRRARRAVRGDIARQFAAKARHDPVLADAVRRADVVLALDQNAIPAAWWLARAEPGPAVVHGVTAAQRVLAGREHGGEHPPTIEW